MKIAVNEIPESPKEISFSERMDELNRILGESKARDFRFPPYLDGNFVYYRSGEDIFFHGSFEGMVEGNCSRCLKSYSFSIAKNFDFVLTHEPLPAKSKGLNLEDMGLSFYAGEEINLSPLIQEQLLLALPMRPLCDERCLGICGGCGANLSSEPCRCDSSPGDPRMAFFRNLRLDR